MKILMIAPQPFFASRGAPLCVYQHIKALVTLGYQVDLVTYPLGEQVSLPGLTIYRIPAPPFIQRVKPGLSLAKFPLDLLIFCMAFIRLWKGRYRYLATHEEAALFGIFLAWIFSCKHLYYMHCDLTQVVPHFRLLVYCMQIIQRFLIQQADIVVVFYPILVEVSRRVAPRTPVYLVQPPVLDEGPLSPEESAIEHSQVETGPILLYTGTLESYQGIEILLHSIVPVRAVYPQVLYLIVGGEPQQIKRLQRLACEIQVQDSVKFVGQRPLGEMQRYMAQATLLLSPRCSGTHTPLKLYSYLRSGKPILATDILSHTQVLTPDIALLVPPTVQGLTQGALLLLRDPERAQALGLEGQRFAEEHYSWSKFLEKVHQVYATFAPLVAR
jgi:glycosyltransferase involved in cell wall biosynthesis